MAGLTDETLLAALYAGGVEDWTWFGDSVERLSDTDMKAPGLVMDALRSGGVDSWEGYGFAVEGLDFGDDDDYGDEGEDEPVAPEEVVAPMLESERRLRAHFGDSYDEQRNAFWARNSNPKVFDRLMKKFLSPGGTLEDVRLAYLDEVIGKE